MSKRETILASILGSAWLVAYLPTWSRLFAIWSRDPQYSHGFLVPLFSIAFLWTRRDRLEWRSVRSNWLGVLVLIAALACRLGTRIFYFEWLEYFSLVLSMVGLVLVAGGWALLRWSGIAIGFLFFMIPFPFRVETLLSLPLQRLATRASCYLLQTFGILAVAEGNVILLENAAAIEVAQACNGLRMAVSFMAISVATALVIRRPLWERVLVVFSAVPIALLSNIARITWTGYLFTAIDQPTGRYFFHEIAGWLMMPLALGLLVLELWLISFLLKERKGAGPVFFPSPTVSRNISANPVN